jgi:ribonuclease HI
MSELNFVVHTDGGARGNPGPAAVGVVIIDTSTNQRHAWGLRIGECTNNVAEYTALLEAVNWIKTAGNLSSERVTAHCYLDSQLVVSQMNGVYKIKDTTLKLLADKIKGIIASGKIVASFHYVPREQNREADRLVNQALDEPFRS